MLRAKRKVEESTSISDAVRGIASEVDVPGITRMAAIMATKRTSDLIPLCHPISLTKVAAG